MEIGTGELQENYNKAKANWASALEFKKGIDNGEDLTEESFDALRAVVKAFRALRKVSVSIDRYDFVQNLSQEEFENTLQEMEEIIKPST